MSEIAEKSGNKGLVIALVILCLMIVGLGVGIGIVYNSKINNKNKWIALNDREGAGVASLDLHNDMVSRFNSDPDYTSEDAIRECKEIINETNDIEFKINLMISCGSFIDKYGEGSGAAAMFLEEEGLKVDLDTVQIGLLENYYYALYDYFSMAKKAQKADYYFQKLNDVLLKLQTVETWRND